MITFLIAVKDNSVKIIIFHKCMKGAKGEDWGSVCACGICGMCGVYMQM